MDEGAITCEGLTRRFASGTAVADLDLTVAQGEVIALLGPNGAGKTTTVRLLNGVLRPDAGRAAVLGLDPWTQGEEVRRRTGVLTEQAGLDERFTALENLVFAASIRGLGRADSERRGRELLDRLGMARRTDLLVRGFSTGERKRVALARALLHEPDVLFLDEPTSGLDPTATKEVVDLIGRLASEQGRTVVLCTHFLGEAGALADRMAVMIHGRLHAVGAPAEIAAEIWSTSAVDVELDQPAAPGLVTSVLALPGVEASTSTPSGLHLDVADREVVPVVLARLVAADARVYGVTVHQPTLEDVYFAIEDRARRRDEVGPDHAGHLRAGGDGVTPPTMEPRRIAGCDVRVLRTLLRRDLGAVVRSKAVLLPILILPFFLLVLLPLSVAAAARNPKLEVDQYLDLLPGRLADPILLLPEHERLIVLVLGYLVAPLFLIVPLMVSAVLAADSFAGEKERRTLETLLHLPVTARDLYVGKLLGAFLPTVAVSWIGFALFAVVSDLAAWGVLERVFLPTTRWMVLILWIAPATAALGLGIMVRVSIRSRNNQEAQQLGGAVVLPLTVLAVGQTTYLLLYPPWVSLVVGGVLWLTAGWLNVRGARSFTRDRMAAQS